MTDTFEDDLQTDLRRLSPRELSESLEERILRRLDVSGPAVAPTSRRPLPWVVAALVAAAAIAAAIVTSLAIWPPRQPGERRELARVDAEQGDRGGVGATHGAAPLEIDDAQTHERDAESPTQSGQQGERTAQSPAPVDEQGQSGQARVGGFQSGEAAAVEDRRESGARADEGSWQRVARGEFADVEVERRLHERPDDERFFVRVRITNKTDRELGVELGESSVIYPNQWGVHPVDHRTIIDERRRDFRELSDEQKSELLRAFGTEALFEIRPKQSITYLRAFEGANCRRQSAAETGYLIVSLDGRLLVTDGREIDDVRCAWNDGGPGGSDLAIRCPVDWKRIPPMETVVDDD